MSDKRILLGAFQVVGSPLKRGILSWNDPKADIMRFHDLDYWKELAQLLDESGFDFLFFADNYGSGSLDGKLLSTAAKYGVNFPMLDPQMLISAVASHTSRLGLVVTETTGLHHPFETARRFATLDHFSKGRMGVNVVTGGSGGSLFGSKTIVAHDERYDRAEEYLEILRAYWRDNWEDDAYRVDYDELVVIDPEKLHPVDYTGRYYSSAGNLPIDPSPQREPVVFQAGTSDRGRRFAAQNAEAVLIQGTTVERNKQDIADIRRRAAEAGRDPAAVKVLVTVTVFVAETAEAAAANRAHFDSQQRDEATAATYQVNTGIDLLALDPDRPLSQIKDDADSTIGNLGRSNIDRFSTPDEDGPTVAEILQELHGRGIRGYQITGDPEHVADQIIELVDETNLDGIMLDPIYGQADIREFIDLVLPRLRACGRASLTPLHGTLREQLQS